MTCFHANETRQIILENKDFSGREIRRDVVETRPTKSLEFLGVSVALNAPRGDIPRNFTSDLQRDDHNTRQKLVAKQRTMFRGEEEEGRKRGLASSGVARARARNFAMRNANSQI